MISGRSQKLSSTTRVVRRIVRPSESAAQFQSQTPATEKNGKGYQLPTTRTVPYCTTVLNFWHSQEEHVEHEPEAEDGQVDPLDRVERGGVLALEEVRRGDERAREGRNALEALADVEPHRGVSCGAEHGDVRVGGHLEAGEAAAYDEGAAHETAVSLELGARPEKDGAWSGIMGIGLCQRTSSGD